MSNDKLKQMVREILLSFYDEIVDTTVTMFSKIAENLPGDMPDEEKEKIIHDMLHKQSDALVKSLKSSVPNNLDEKLKEASNGRK